MKLVRFSWGEAAVCVCVCVLLLCMLGAAGCCALSPLRAVVGMPCVPFCWVTALQRLPSL